MLSLSWLWRKPLDVLCFWRRESALKISKFNKLICGVQAPIIPRQFLSNYLEIQMKKFYLAGFLCQNKVYFKVWNWQWLQEYEDNNNNCITKCLGRGPGRWGSSTAWGQHSAFSLFSVFSSVTALHCYTHYNDGCWNEHFICKTGWKINYYWNCEWAVY